MPSRAPSSSPPTTTGSSRATTRPSSRRSQRTAATSRSRPAPATSSPTTTPIRRPVPRRRGLPLRPADPGAGEGRGRRPLPRRRQSLPPPRRLQPLDQRRRPLHRVRQRPLLAAVDTNDNVDVYVRDMALPFDAPGAFDLVSARDGGDTRPATDAPGSVRGSQPGRTYRAACRSAATARRWSSAPKSRPTCRRARPSTCPPVRSSSGIATRTGRRWSPRARPRERRDDQPTGRRRARRRHQRRRHHGGLDRHQRRSADPFPRRREPTRDSSITSGGGWPTARGAPTRRITGLADPDDPEPRVATLFDQTSTGPCSARSPIRRRTGGHTAQLPALSGDGYTVAFLTGSGPRPLAFTGPASIST